MKSQQNSLTLQWSVILATGWAACACQTSVLVTDSDLSVNCILRLRQKNVQIEKSDMNDTATKTADRTAK